MLVDLCDITIMCKTYQMCIYELHVYFCFVCTNFGLRGEGCSIWTITCWQFYYVIVLVYVRAKQLCLMIILIAV